MPEGLKLFVATKAFISYKDKILLLQESSNYKEGTQLGKFDVPGGRLSPGETVEDCLGREISEETGLSVNSGRPFFVNESRPTVNGEKWQVIRIFFSVDVDTDVVTLSEDHEAHIWIDPKDYKDHHVIENLYPVFEAYLESKNK